MGIEYVNRKEYFLVDVQDDSLILHTPGIDPGERAGLLSKLFGGLPMDEASNRSWIGANSVYLPIYRFSLVDEDKRLFSVARWCFKGSIDDWFPLSSGRSLEKQARTFLAHLGKKSFYDLM